MEKKKKGMDLLLDVLDVARMFFLSFLLLVIVTTFVLKPATVSGESMYPTLEDGEKVFSNVLLGIFGEIERGDIVVVREPNTKELWVKRVIALPNETVEIKEGNVYVNGVILEEPYLDQAYMQKVVEEKNLAYFNGTFPAYTCKEDEYFLMGDNRNSSLDSRIHGAFLKSEIIAKDVYVYYPFSKMKILT